MKKVTFVLFFFLLSIGVFTIPVSSKTIEKVPVPNTGNPRPRVPAIMPRIYLHGHILSFIGTHPNYILVLYDEDGNEVFIATIPESLKTFMLPETLSGFFELQLYHSDRICFSSTIALEG